MADGLAVSTYLTLKDVENELQEVTAADWFPLGVQLGIKRPKLKEIEVDHRGDVRRCKCEVLDWWHRNAPEISWKKLADALEKTGGYDALAQRLRRKILTNEDQVTSMKSLPDKSGATNSEETISQSSLVANNGNKGLYSLVKADPLATSKEFDSVEENLIIETHDIQSEFNILFTKVLEDLVSQGVNVRRFVLFLKRVPSYAGRSLFDAELPKLYEASDLVDVFEIVGDHCSWFNHSFLKQILKTYCDCNNQLEKAYKNFYGHLQRYCRHRVSKCPLENGFGSGGKKDRKVVMKVDREWDSIRIEQLEDVMFNVAQILNIKRSLLLLSSVQQGCVQLTLLVPCYIPDVVFPFTAEQEAAMIEIGVTDLQCGSYHFSHQAADQIFEAVHLGDSTAGESLMPQHNLSTNIANKEMNVESAKEQSGVFLASLQPVQGTEETSHCQPTNVKRKLEVDTYVVQVTKRVPARLQAQGVLTSKAYSEVMQRLQMYYYNCRYNEANRITARLIATVSVEFAVSILLENCKILMITNRPKFFNRVDEARKMCSQIATDNYVCLRGRCELVSAMFYLYMKDHDKALEHIRKAMEIQYNLAAGEDTALTNYVHARILLTSKKSMEETKKTKLALEYAIAHCRIGNYELKDSYPFILLAQLHLGSYPSLTLGRNDDPDSIMKARSSLEAVSMEHLTCRAMWVYFLTKSDLHRNSGEWHQAIYFATLAQRTAQAHRFEMFSAKERLRGSGTTPNDTTVPEHANATVPEHANATVPEHANATVPEHANATVPEHANATVPEHANATVPEHANEAATPECSNESSLFSVFMRKVGMFVC